MPCFSPLQGFRTAGGDVVFVERGDIVSTLDLPCGRCIGCRLERSRMWATRLMFERQLHDEACFVTLTYNDENAPFPPSLDYPQVQKFLKRLRFRLRRKIRFFAVGEYGSENARPHYHLILFGVDFSDSRSFYKLSPSGENLFRSPVLEELWPFGFSSIGDVTFESCAYCARYCLKKVTGDLAELHYRFVDVDTGEVHMRVPEFAHMSLKPGIGSEWFDRFSSDVYSGHDYVVINGRKCKPPRYFDKLYKRLSKDDFLELKTTRELNGYPRRSENMPSRLAAREAVTKAAISNLKRKL